MHASVNLNVQSEQSASMAISYGHMEGCLTVLLIRIVDIRTVIEHYLGGPDLPFDIERCKDELR